jgi:hypothetical protein
VIRIRLSCKNRVEYFDFDHDVVLGRGEGADLSIDHPSINPRHARLLLRRGRLILADLGGLVAIGEERLRAATTIREGEIFRVGDVEASACVMSEASAIGRSLGEVRLEAEQDAISLGTRRYQGTAGGRRAEVTVADPDAFESHELEAWVSRMERSEGLAPALLARGELDGRPAIAERVPLGIRLSSLIEDVESDRVAVSRELALAVLRRLLESIAPYHDAIGPHAGLVPRAVQLTLDGDVLLLRGGPRPSHPVRDARWCSSMRRMNLPPSLADDAFALVRIGEVLGGRAIAEELPHPEQVHARASFTEWASRLLALSNRWGVDPSALHVARVVRLLTDRGRPLAIRNARL